MKPLKLRFLDLDLSICRLGPDSGIPQWAENSSFLSLVKTEDELSIVCESALIPENPSLKTESGWIAIMVLGPLDFSEVGILSAIAGTLAQQGISIFAISSFDTDYLLIRRANKDLAKKALSCQQRFLLQS